MPTQSTPNAVPTRRGWTLAIVSIALFMATLDNLVVGVALPSIRISLGGSLESLEWTTNAYTLAFAVLLITGGALGDRFGRKRMFVVGTGLFTIASALAAFAPSTGLLIAARGIQGLGAAFLVPLTLTLISEAFPADKRGAALGIWAGVSGLGVALGPFVGGAVVEGLAWQWIFWLNVPIGIALLPLAWCLLTESHGPNRELDLRGLGLIGVGLFGVTFGIIRATTLGWTSPTVIVSLTAGAVLVAGFVWWELRAPRPMLPMRFFALRAFSATNGASFAMFFGVFGSIFLLSQFFQTGQGYGPFEAGLRTLPWTAMPMLVAPLAGAFSDRIGSRPLMATGLALQAGAIGWLSLVCTPEVAYGSLLVPLIMGGTGMALVFAPSASAVLGAARPEEAGQVSGATNAIRQLGGVMGVAVLASVFSANGSYASQQAFSDGLVAALPVGAAVLAVGAVVALLVPGHLARKSEAAAEPAEPEPEPLRRHAREALSPEAVERAREWHPSHAQRPLDAIQPHDAGSPAISSRYQPSSGLKIAVPLAGLCAVVGVGLFLLLRADAREVTVYSSLPLQGPERTRAEDTIRGIRLALKQAGSKAGKFHVNFVSLDDSTAETRGWESSAVIANAARAADDDRTAAYIGELNSGASALSIPVLSGAKVPQISPSNTAVGLTTGESGADAGEPGKYYVGGFRNYVRLVPRDTIQGAVLATLMRDDKCERSAIIHDRDLYGEGLALNIRLAMAKQGLRRVLDEPFESRLPMYHRTLARRLGQQRADCVVFIGDDTSAAVRIFNELDRVLPEARLYGSDGVVERAFTDVNRGGLSEPVGARVKLTMPALSPEGFGAAGQTFFARFRQEYPDHKNPDPYAIYGYEAMSLALDAIKRAGSSDREDIVKALFATKDRSSVIGRYSIDENGDTTLTDYGAFAIRDGAPTFDRTVKPRN